LVAARLDSLGAAECWFAGRFRFPQFIRYEDGKPRSKATSCGRRRFRLSLLSALGLLDRARELDA
jgi:hypothetical protein